MQLGSSLFHGCLCFIETNNQAVCLTKIVCSVYLNFDEGGTVLSLSLVGKVPRV